RTFELSQPMRLWSRASQELHGGAPGEMVLVLKRGNEVDSPTLACGSTIAVDVEPGVYSLIPLLARSDSFLVHHGRHFAYRFSQSGDATCPIELPLFQVPDGGKEDGWPELPRVKNDVDLNNDGVKDYVIEYRASTN